MDVLEIICLSHLALEPTHFQRPQHLMSEFARRGHRVAYIGCVGRDRARKLANKGWGQGEISGMAFRNVEFSAFVIRPQPIRRYRVLRAIADELSRRTKSDFPSALTRVVWLYHPALIRLIQPLNPDLVVYDVMDRYVSFGKSHPALRQLETSLYRWANVIFAGGTSLAAAANNDLRVLGIQKHVHCFPSGVDLDHFTRAMSDEITVAADLAAIPSPRLGYFGAVDERLDFELLAQMAGVHPDWHIVLIGPIIGSPPPMLPPNIHLMGARPYNELPRYLKGFDLCLLPFRDSELVRYVSPTKTPEYLAGGKPVLSTFIPDVQVDYGDVVTMARSPAEFLASAEYLLQNPLPAKSLHSTACKRAATWSTIATGMETILFSALRPYSNDI